MRTAHGIAGCQCMGCTCSASAWAHDAKLWFDLVQPRSAAVVPCTPPLEGWAPHSMLKILPTSPNLHPLLRLSAARADPSLALIAITTTIRAPSLELGITTHGAHSS